MWSGLSFSLALTTDNWDVLLQACTSGCLVCCYLVCFCQEKRRSVDKKSHARMIQEKEIERVAFSKLYNNRQPL